MQKSNKFFNLDHIYLIDDKKNVSRIHKKSFFTVRGEREKKKLKQTFWECVVNEKRNFLKKKMDLWEKIIPFIPEFLPELQVSNLKYSFKIYNLYDSSSSKLIVQNVGSKIMLSIYIIANNQ
jgi:hypothetical protein